MAFENSQKERSGRISGPFPPDQLVLVEMSGYEGINELFEFRVTALAASGTKIDLDTLLGRSLTIELLTLDGGSRWFDGIVAEAESLGPFQGPNQNVGEGFLFLLRPWYWALGMRQNSRVFHNLSVVSIIEKVFAPYRGESGSFGNLRNRTVHAQHHTEPEYVVQYCESDLDFTRRLMEEYGINFHFEMRKDEHSLVITDDADHYEAVPGKTRVFRAVGGQHRADAEHFAEWTQRRQMRPGVVRMTDYNFKTPNSNMTAQQKASATYEKGNIEVYQPHGRYEKPDQGQRFAKVRLDALQSPDGRIEAAGDVLSLAAGIRVNLTEHPEAAMNTGYVALACNHRYVAEGYRSGGGGAQGGEDSYEGLYVLQRLEQPLAPARLTPRGRVLGPLTGIVIGTGEIDCDEFGRILVRFPWEDEGSGTMRCRVLQSWAGAKWGSIYIPRVGMEVVVEFLDGDPDRPIVTGAVYNQSNKPPFPLPANQTISGIKSNSSRGGGGPNQFTFEDKKGAESIDLHAQKDLNLKVLNNETREVDVDESFTIGGSVAGLVCKDRSVKIRGSETLDVSKDMMITSSTKITLKVGSSSIVIDGQSITIEAAMIRVDAKMSLVTKSGMTAEHTAGANLTINGLLVMIN
jgi:type VI secretion system secreted protein VgrG